MGNKDMQFKLRLDGCAAVDGPNDVLPIALAIPRFGFLPADGKAPDLTPAEDIAALVATHTRTMPSGPAGTWWVAFDTLPQWTSYLIGSCSCRDSREGIVGCQLSTLIERKDFAQVEPFAQRLLSLSLDLYSLLKPAIGWIDESYANETLSEQVKKTKLVSISWVNLFGPPYVAKYGKEFLLGIPGYKTEQMPDGGIFQQLTPTFLVEDAREARSLRQAVKEHFAKAGLKVSCRAPYVRSQLFGKEEAPSSSTQGYGTLGEFRAVLAQLLATTLVIEGGTRVKVLDLEWGALGGEKRRLALEMIKRAAEAELADHPEAAIRFEFNEIPADLRRQMDKLVQAHRRLSYERIVLESE